ncbi:MAG: glycosyl transferase, partial [Acinetobacter sp.]|nr:glycosyl transferase [Acinetobacter sp.]
RSPAEDELDLAVFQAVWEGRQNHEYGETAAVETMGIALYAMGACSNYEAAMDKAKALWDTRNSH